MALAAEVENKLKVQTRILFDIYKKEGEEFFQNGDIRKALQSYNLKEHKAKVGQDRQFLRDSTSPLPSAGFPNRLNCQLQRIHRKRPPELRDPGKMSTATSVWSIPSTISEYKIPEEKAIRYILGHLYEDKKYLEKLNVNLRFIDPRIVDKVDDGLGFLFDRVMFWRRLGPLPPPPPTRRHGSYLDILRKRREEFVDREKRKMRDIGIIIDDRTKSFLDRFNSVESLPKHDVIRTSMATNENTFARRVGGRIILPSIVRDNEAPGKVVTGKKKRGATRKRQKEKQQDSESPKPPPLTFNFNSVTNEEEEVHVEEIPSHRPIYLGEEDEEDDEYTKSYRDDCDEPVVEHTSVDDEKAIVENYIARELDKLEGAFTFRRYEKVMHMAEALLRQVEEYATHNLKNKSEVLALIHSYLGNAAIELEDFDKAIYHHQIDIDLGEEFEMDDSLSRGYGNLGRVYVLQKKHHKALELFAKKAPLCNTPLETAWLFNEIANLFMAIRAYVYARDSAQRAFESAIEAVNQSFQLQACSVMAIAEAKVKNNKAAKTHFEKALQLAESEDDPKAQEAIKQALQTINMKLVNEIKLKEKVHAANPDKKQDGIPNEQKHQTQHNATVVKKTRKVDRIKLSRQNMANVLQKPRNPGLAREKTVSDVKLSNSLQPSIGKKTITVRKDKTREKTELVYKKPKSKPELKPDVSQAIRTSPMQSPKKSTTKENSESEMKADSKHVISNEPNHIDREPVVKKSPVVGTSPVASELRGETSSNSPVNETHGTEANMRTSTLVCDSRPHTTESKVETPLSAGNDATDNGQ